jgi:hypothetical protein
MARLASSLAEAVDAGAVNGDGLFWNWRTFFGARVYRIFAP